MNALQVCTYVCKLSLRFTVLMHNKYYYQMCKNVQTSALQNVYVCNH